MKVGTGAKFGTQLGSCADVARRAALYRQAMQIDDHIDNPTEAIMSDTATMTTTTLRYGYQPSSAFAATRAGAARRARETAAESTSANIRPSWASGLLHRVSVRFSASSDRG
jgi:hypothetical protein